MQMWHCVHKSCIDGTFFASHSSIRVVSVQDAQDDRESRRDTTITEAQILEE